MNSFFGTLVFEKQIFFADRSLVVFFDAVVFCAKKISTINVRQQKVFKTTARRVHFELQESKLGYFVHWKFIYEHENNRSIF